MFRNFKIKSNLTEKQVESDVATYLSWISPAGSLPYRLLDIDEQITGADKRLDLVTPVYMQFKVSQGLKPLRSRMLLGFSNTPLQQIREYRKVKDLSDNPTLYFKLRDQAKNANDLQHNVLLKLNDINGFRAFYVAPLILDKDEYYNLLCGPALRPTPDPFYYREIAIHDNSWVSYVGMIPFLRAHISIPPMERVTNSDHYYSFASTGDEIAFHSPSGVPGVHRLSDELMSVIRHVVNSDNSWLYVQECISSLTAALSLQNQSFSNNSPLETLQQIGKYIYETFGIRQFLFLSSKEKLTKHMR